MLRLAKGVGLDIVLWCLGIALLGVNVLLLQQNRSLQATANGPDTSVNIQEGKHLSRYLAAATLDNGFRPISFPAPDAKRTLLITFSPVCPHCKANHKNWSVIAEELRRQGGWRVLWVSRDPVEMTKDYCEDSDIPVAEAFADPTYRAYMVLDLKTVPNTVVIDAKGVADQLWHGELDAAGWRNVSASFTYRPPSRRLCNATMSEF